ncbi:MAG: response regulator [Ignavibacteriaceae bacterium]
MKQNDFKKILLVEDDPNDIELTIEALKDYNLSNDLAVVRDGEDALDYLRYSGKYKNRPPGNPVVILLDLKLPKIDGLQVLRQIRSDEKLSLIPVIALTSSREEQDLVHGYNIGTNAYVIKPLDLKEFIETAKNIGIFEELTK